MTSEPTVRLNKYLALALGISRREADDLIAAGHITIDGEIAALGARCTETSQQIRKDGKEIAATPDYQYLAFNKPVGYVCSRRAQGDAPTIYDLLPEKFHTLKPVGRLDKNSSGILLLTNDGDFAYQMTHPKFHKTKIYEVSLDHSLQPLHRQMISDYGVMLEDGKSKFEIARPEMSPGTANSATVDTAWQITMHEGRNRQIRRTFAALGYEVSRLHRTTFGTYHIGQLSPGKFEIITK